MVTTLITTSSLASLFLEGIKYLIRSYLKDPNYDFDLKFYSFALPILQLLVQPALVFLGILPAIQMTLSLQTILIVAIESLMSIFVYENTLKPLKEYNKMLKVNGR